jgi:glycosyltransferase involved in cell wall biosynthesis
LKKICVDARMLGRSGIGTYLENILKRVRINSIHWCALIHPDQESSCFGGMELIPISTPIYSPFEQIDLARKIPRCDLFWSPHFNVPILPILSKKRLATIHDLFHLAYPKLFNRMERFYARFLIQQAVYRSDQIITDSHFSKSELCKYTSVASDKIEVVHLAVDLERFSPNIQNSHMLKNFGIRNKFLLYVGNQKVHKNVQALLLAFDLLDKKGFSDLDLVCIGNSKGMKRIDNLCTKETLQHLSHRVHFVERVSDEELVNFYRSAELMIFPSLYEGFGLPPLEAMACGCPTICSYAASLPEVCKKATLYCNPYNYRHIAQIIEYVITDIDIRNQLIAKGLQLVKGLSWELAAQKHLEKIDQLIGI